MRHAPGRAWFRPTIVWRPLSRLLLAFLLFGGIASCTDGGAPTAPGMPGTLRLLLQPDAVNTCTPSAPVTHIRLTAKADPGGAVLVSRTFSAPPASSGTWDLPFEVPVTAGVARVTVLIELLSVTAGSEVVQCSGLTESVSLVAGSTQETASPTLYNGPPDVLSVSSVTITTPIPPALREGETLQLAAEIQPAGNARVTWLSLDPEIATVDQQGLVRLLRDGVARIVAQAGPRSAVAIIQSLQRPAAISVLPASLTAASLGEEAVFTATVLDARGAPVPDVAVAWSIDNAAIATSLGNGVFRAAANGATTVRASIPGTTSAASASLVVRQQVTSVAVSPGSFAFPAIGATTGLTAVARDARGQTVGDATFEWSSSEPGVATVSGTGLVTAVDNGTATITVRSGTASATASVQVQQAMARLEMSPESLLLQAVGATGQLRARPLDANGHEIAGVPVQWATSDPSVAAVDGSGLVTAIANGVATITARASGMSADASVTVQQSAGSVQLTPSSRVAHSLGEVVAFSAALLDAGGTVIAGAAFDWSIAGPAVAESLGDGSFRALADGTTEVTATSQDGQLSATATLTVSQRAARVEVSPGSFVFTAIGLTTQLTAAAFDANGNPVPEPAFDWSVDGESVTVDGTGLVTAAAAGTSTVQATAAGGAAGAAIVSVRQTVASLDASPAVLRLTHLGATAGIQLTARDSRGHLIVTPEGIAWTSSAPAATVDQTGLVTAAARGSAVVTASAGAIAAQVDVTVEQTPASIQIAPDGLNFASLGESASIAVTVRDAGDAIIPDAAFTLAASDAGVVDVSGNVVTARKNGTATITATIGALSDVIEVTVLQLADQIDVQPVLVELEVGGSVQLAAQMVDARGNPIPGTPFGYSAVDPAIAAVDEQGLVTGVSPGTTHIEVQGGGLSALVQTIVSSGGGGDGGVISGRVVHALTQAPIADATVTFDRTDVGGSIVVRSGRPVPQASQPVTTTGPDGRYASPPMAAGIYRITISAEGFITTQVHDVVVSSGPVDVETVPLVPFSTQTGGIAGRILNAQTGAGIQGVTVELRSGVNALTGPVVATTTSSSGGQYSFAGLAAGTYSVLARLTGFVPGSRTGISVGGTVVNNQDISLVDEAVTEGEIRIVLTWGQNPSDLDSHLTGPISGSSSRFHVYWANPGSLTSSPFASLDVDDVTSFGPETITISQQFPGLYRYTVHHWSGSGNLGTSSAVVRVFRGNTQIARFEAPPMTSFAEWWHVFDLSGDTLTPVNTYSNSGAANGMSAAQFEQFLSVGKK